MKKLKPTVAIISVVLFIASCEKDDTNSTPSCQINCENGGVVTSTCSCDCPDGYTGLNCEIKTNPVQIVTVNRNPGTYYQIKPVRSNGDNEFDGIVDVTIKVDLEISSDKTKVYAVSDALFYEPKGDYSTAIINPNLSSSRILLYTAPSGKKIDYINSTTGIIMGPVRLNSTGTHFVNNLSVSNHFLHKIEFIADTSGDDLPSDGSSDRCRYRIYFDDFEVAISNK